MSKVKTYYEQNKEKKIAWQKEYYARNLDARREYGKAYRAKNREELNAKRRAYVEKNRDELNAKRRAWRAKNIDEHRAKARDYYADNREHIHEYDRKNYAEHYRERAVEAKRRRRKLHPEQAHAHNVVTKALMSGKLLCCPCEVCGCEKVDAHHDDYSKTLEVRWLCRQHHADHHRLEVQ